MKHRVFSAPTRWLNATAINDPVDRRNAPILQVVLLLLSTLPPLLWLYRIAGTDIPWRPSETASLVGSLAISMFSAWSLVLIRRGHFQWAIRQLIAVVAAMMLLSYANGGLEAQTYEQPIQVMWLFVAGMMIGRWALWPMYAVLVVSLLVGANVDAARQGVPLGDLSGDVVIRSVMFLIIALVVDRAVAALRSSLNDALQSSSELAASTTKLFAEITAREQAQAQLLHAQKVEAVGRMASGVAHDFNHLLTLMLGYAERARQTDDPSTRAEMLAGLETAVRRATAITDKLLRFGRQDVAVLEHFDAGDALRELQPMLRPTLDPGIRLDMTLADGPSPIEFDRAQFALAMLNLTANAGQAMPDGGRLTIRLLASNDEAVAIEVQDTGHGMPEAVRLRVFEPFFTTKPAGQGTGLGLAVVAGLVSEASGRIEVHSTPGQGTRFTVHLPARDTASAAA